MGAWALRLFLERFQPGASSGDVSTEDTDPFSPLYIVDICMIFDHDEGTMETLRHEGVLGGLCFSSASAAGISSPTESGTFVGR